MSKLTLSQAMQYGFIFPNAKAFYDRGNVAKLAMDAALQTTPNTNVLANRIAPSEHWPTAKRILACSPPLR